MIGRRVRTTQAKTARNVSTWVRQTDDVWHAGREGWLLSGICADRVLIGWNDTGSEWSWVPVACVEVIA